MENLADIKLVFIHTVISETSDQSNYWRVKLLKISTLPLWLFSWHHSGTMKIDIQRLSTDQEIKNIHCLYWIYAVLTYTIRVCV